VGGLALALMETAADFGVADYFGVGTLSVGIFRTWYGLGDLVAASQLAGGLFLIALVLSLIEERTRRGLGAEGVRGQRAPQRIRLGPLAAMGAMIFCAAPFLLGFGAPVSLLIAKLTAGSAEARGLAEAASNTAVVAAIGALVAALLAAILAYSARRSRAWPMQAALRISTMGYALPGAVIAIGVLAFAAAVKSTLGIAAASLSLLLYAYVARFLTGGYNTIAGGIAQIHPLTDDAARMLGAGPASVITRIHLPIARGAFAAGAFIVLIDIAKELPATLLLRPFNFETLATRIYRLASDERLTEAAPAALILVALSLAPVLWLEAISRRQDARMARSTLSQIKST
jgi:iron(III) transport system permease protein